MPLRHEASQALLDQLRARRVELGLTQEIVAKVIGSQQKDVSEWERGAHMPALSSFVRVAEAVGLHVALVPCDRRAGHG